MSETRTGSPVTVGCKLPNGLVLKVGEKKLMLRGSNSSRIVGGYGLTSVPADLWDAWSKAYAGSPFITRNLIFAQTSAARAESQANEQASVKSGLEPIDPSKAPAGIEKAEK